MTQQHDWKQLRADVPPPSSATLERWSRVAVSHGALRVRNRSWGLMAMVAVVLLAVGGVWWGVEANAFEDALVMGLPL